MFALSRCEARRTISRSGRAEVCWCGSRTLHHRIYAKGFSENTTPDNAKSGNQTRRYRRSFGLNQFVEAKTLMRPHINRPQIELRSSADIPTEGQDTLFGW